MVHKKRIAIIYDWIDTWGGVERILLRLHSLFPDATFFSSLWNKERAEWSSSFKIQTSFIQRFPQWMKKKRVFIVPFLPFAFETFDFSTFDVVITVTSSFAKGIITSTQTKHICYLLTPPRYLWSHESLYLPHKAIRFIASPLLCWLKKWDFFTSKRPDMYVAISNTVADRCYDYYSQKAMVLYPPFDTYYWDKLLYQQKGVNYLSSKTPFYLWVGRLEQYKMPDLLIKVALHLPQKKFIFVGTGSLQYELQKRAPKNCIFLGKIEEVNLAYMYTHAEALIMPQEEDFGYVALEAQYAGCPVIAYRKGGATETIIEQKTGIFFDEQSEMSLLKVLERYEQISYNLKHSTRTIGKQHCKMFEGDQFDRQFRLLVN